MGRELPKHTGLQGMRGRGGFLLGELLAALLIISLLIPVSLFAVQTAIGSLDFDENVQDEIAAAQLRRILMMSYDIEVDGACLHMNYLDREMRIIYGNGHVYMTPGTMIFFNDVDNAWFEQEGDVVYVWIERNGTSRKIAAAQNK